MKNLNPYHYLLKSSFEIILWIALYFCFKHDYRREDFVFIPIQASWIMALIFGLTLIRIATQFSIKLNKYNKNSHEHNS